MKLKCLIIGMLMPSLVFCKEYRIRSGETLSNILYERYAGRIYGKGNNLAKLIEANPQIKDPNFVEVGLIIFIPNDFIPLRKLEELNKNESLPQVNAQEKVSKNKSLPNQELLVGIAAYSKSLSAVEKVSQENAIAKSDFSYGLELKWVHLWSDKINYFVLGRLASYQFNVAQNKSLEESQISQTELFTGVNYRYNSVHTPRAYIGMDEKLFLNSNNNTELKIDKVIIPEIGLGAHHLIHEFQSHYQIKTFWDIAGLLPTKASDFDTEFGYKWNIGFGSFYSKSNRNYHISFEYGQAVIETDEVEQTNKQLKISTAYGWSY